MGHWVHPSKCELFPGKKPVLVIFSTFRLERYISWNLKEACKQLPGRIFNISEEKTEQLRTSASRLDKNNCILL